MISCLNLDCYCHIQTVCTDTEYIECRKLLIAFELGLVCVEKGARHEGLLSVMDHRQTDTHTIPRYQSKRNHLSNCSVSLDTLSRRPTPKYALSV